MLDMSEAGVIGVLFKNSDACTMSEEQLESLARSCVGKPVRDEDGRVIGTAVKAWREGDAVHGILR